MKRWLSRGSALAAGLVGLGIGIAAGLSVGPVEAQRADVTELAMRAIGGPGGAREMEDVMATCPTCHQAYPPDRERERFERIGRAFAELWNMGAPWPVASWTCNKHGILGCLDCKIDAARPKRQTRLEE